MKRMNGSLAAHLRAPDGARRFAAISLVAAPVLMIAWLLMAAIPALADGGPHVAATNSGASTLTADSCAGCHRAHTAQGPMLLAAADEEALCLTCHGATSSGATTDVMTGIQYASGAAHVAGGAPLGALRSGGFDQARIASSTPARVFQSGTALNVWGKVGVGTAQDVTSAHLNLTENGLTAPTVAWGNDGLNSGAGPTVSMTCASCHNPHGNGQYRILNPIPKPDATSIGTFVPVTTPGVTVTDAALPAPGDTRNYTVIQKKGTQGTPSTFLLYASQIASGPTTGDYWHVRVPWTDGVGSISDAPNGNPSGLTPFNDQIEAWCTACHTRYHAGPGSDSESSGDNLFAYRHQTGGRTTCTTCHVAHGSNAAMSGDFSKVFPYPGSTSAAPNISPSSRLLKVDNRGTCQMCHDPTNTVASGQYTGPTPTPGVP